MLADWLIEVNSGTGTVPPFSDTGGGTVPVPLFAVRYC